MVKTLWPELALKLPPRLLPRKVTMALKLRPSDLSSAIDEDRIGDPRRSRQSALVLVDDRQRSDDALGSGGDPGRGQGAVSEELGRLEGVGEAGRGRLNDAA